MHRRSLRLTRFAPVAALALGLLAGGCASSPTGANDSGVVISTPKDTSPYNGTEERRYTLPDITLTDASGERFNLASDTDKPVTLVFFGYTHCPDVCPTTVAHITQALRQAPEPVRDKTQFVFLTSDPARDTPQRLQKWLGRFDDSYVGLTGELNKIEKVAKKLGVPLDGKVKKLPSGGYLVGHGSQVLAFGPDGKSRVLWTAGTPVGTLSEDIAKLVRTTAKA